METMMFAGPSRLTRIGAQVFVGCKLHPITIPALTEEIERSTFVNWLLLAVGVAPGSLNFEVEGKVKDHL
jgi:hypothetical protein